MGKRKVEDHTFWEKKKKKKQKKKEKVYHNDTCRWKRDSFSSEVEITREIVWIKILSKKRLLKKV